MNRGTSSSAPTVPGLVNFGNTCYANALLQALASCETYVEYVSLAYRTFPVSNPIPQEGETRHSGELNWQARMPLLRAIACCLQRLQPSPSQNEVMLASSLEVLHAIGYHNRKLFNGDGEQQDVAEVLDCIIASTNNEMNTWKKLHISSPVRPILPGENQQTLAIRNKDNNNKISSGSKQKVDYSGIMMNNASGPRQTNQLERQALSMVKFQSSGSFEGLLSHHLECRECGHVFNIQLNHFTSLLLPITQVRLEGREFKIEAGANLEACLSDYFANKIQGPICCPKCSFYCTLTSVRKSGGMELSGSSSRGVSNLRRSASSSTSTIHEDRSSYEEEYNNFTPIKRTGLTDILPSNPPVSLISSSGPKLLVASQNTTRRTASLGGVLYHGNACFDLKEFENNSLKPRRSANFGREAAARKVMFSANGSQFQDHQVLNFRKVLSENGVAWVDVDSHVNAQVSISKLPKVLALSLQRKIFDGSGYRKIQGRVQYPLILDVTPYLQHRSIHNSRYRLKAVIVHFGDEIGGHYLTVRCVEFPGYSTWILASDDKIRQVSEKAVLGLEASMLFYEREPDKKNTSTPEVPVFVRL